MQYGPYLNMSLVSEELFDCNYDISAYVHTSNLQHIHVTV